MHACALPGTLNSQHTSTRSLRRGQVSASNFHCRAQPACHHSRASFIGRLLMTDRLVALVGGGASSSKDVGDLVLVAKPATNCGREMGGPRGPNVLITGTPGTGKTCTCEQIEERAGLKHVNVGHVVRMKQCHEGRDEAFDTFILDEEKLLDALEDEMEEGGNVVDFHSCDFFPEHWFDLVLVLRAETSILYDRLQARGYTPKKVGENVECEIMQVVLEEAKESYPEEAVHEVPSNTVEDLESNVSRISQWLEAWKADNEGKT